MVQELCRSRGLKLRAVNVVKHKHKHLCLTLHLKVLHDQKKGLALLWDWLSTGTHLSDATKAAVASGSDQVLRVDRTLCDRIPSIVSGGKPSAV